MSGERSPAKRRGKRAKDESRDRLLPSAAEGGDLGGPRGDLGEPSVEPPAPVPAARSLSAPAARSFAAAEGGCRHACAYGCRQLAPSPAAQHSAREAFAPPPLQRTLSTPEPYRPLLHRAGSAFGNFRGFARGRGSGWAARSHGCRSHGSVRGFGDAGGSERSLPHQHSDPGASAFRPVWSAISAETDDTGIESEPASLETGSGTFSSGGVASPAGPRGEREEGKKPSPPRLGSKLLSGIKGALNRRRMSGRENPVSLLAEEEEGEEDEAGEVEVEEERFESKAGFRKEGEQVSEQARAASVDMYSDSDLEDELPIVGQYHLLDEERDPRPPSAELPSVEVIAEGLAGASLSGHVVEALRPPSAEAVTPPQKVRHCDDIPETESPAYHPLVDEHDDDGEACHDTSMTTVDGFPIQLTYKSPSKSNSSPESHSIRSGNTNHTAQTDSSQADYEVRAVNRQGSLAQLNRLNREEVVVDLDGNATVHSSSTSSSNYHMHSPKMREGACMPVDRFFAGGNVVLTPRGAGAAPLSSGSEGGGLPEMNISKFLSLSPKKSRQDAGAHSPHTVSSASVSNTSSSGSETKKPPKFVAYKERMESPTKSIEDCTRLALEEGASASTPTAKRTIGALIKPRISKGAGQRPPIQHFASYQKPPQSPRKDSVRASGTRTPTRTPPPAREYGSGATTPCSPPVIVDGPNAMRGDLRYREGTTRPHVVRSSGGPVVPSGYLRLHPPSSEYLFRGPSREVSPLRENVTVMVDEGANDGAQEVFAASFFEEEAAYTATMPKLASYEAVVTPEKRYEQSSQKRNEQDCKKSQNVAMVSPDKQC